MMYLLLFCIAIVAITITKFAVPFILSRTKIPHHLVTTVNFFLNIAISLSIFFVLFVLLQMIGIVNTTDEIAGEQHKTASHPFKSKDEKKSIIIKEEYPLAEEKKERERKEQELKEQELLRALKAEKERRIELEKERRLAEEKKERERKEQELKEQELLRALEAEKERRVELEKERRLAEEKKERERKEQERLRKLEEEKKSPCEKIKDSLDKRLLNNAIKKVSNDVMTVLQNRQGIRCYIIPIDIKRGCIEYQIQKEGSSELCFYYKGEGCKDR